mmetsp:Transcript_21026/g.46328  ORF Transcript_21026/g.46328 Transcript_21026/m.46328 type:complete len:597 (+) Transcript_21026:42-1832(+)
MRDGPAKKGIHDECSWNRYWGKVHGLVLLYLRLNQLAYVVVAFPIGTVLSIVPLYLNQVLDVPLTTIGISMMCGELLGVVAMKVAEKLQNGFIVRRPYDLHFIIITVGSFLCLIAVPGKNLWVLSVAAMMGVQCFNSASKPVIGEAVHRLALMASFAPERAFAQANMLRRIGNATIGASSPLVYSLVNPRAYFFMIAPFLLSFGAYLAWFVWRATVRLNNYMRASQSAIKIQSLQRGVKVRKELSEASTVMDGSHGKVCRGPSESSQTVVSIEVGTELSIAAKDDASETSKVAMPASPQKVGGELSIPSTHDIDARDSVPDKVGRDLSISSADIVVQGHQSNVSAEGITARGSLVTTIMQTRGSLHSCQELSSLQAEHPPSPSAEVSARVSKGPERPKWLFFAIVHAFSMLDAALSRLPFVFLAVAVAEESSVFVATAVLAVYQLSRALSQGLQMYRCDSLVNYALTSWAVVAYLTMLVYVLADDTPSHWYFLVMLTGVAETLPVQQHFLLKMFSNARPEDARHVNEAVKASHTATGIGSALAFLSAPQLYTHWGLSGVGLLGVSISVMKLIVSLAIQLGLRRLRPRAVKSSVPKL